MFQKEKLNCENSKLLWLGKNDSTLCNTFVFKPENGKENLGDLIILLKMDEDNRDNREIAQGLVEVIKEEFYSDPGRSPEESLETGLIKANEILRDLASLGKISWIGKLNAVAACLACQKLVITQTGKTASILIRGSEPNFINTKTSQEQEKEESPRNLFSGIAVGNLESGDALILSTATLLEFFPPLKLVQILSEMDIKSARDYIQKLLIGQAEKETIGAILLTLNKQAKAQPIIAIEKEEMTPEEMMEEVSPAFDEAITRRLEARRNKKFPYILFYYAKILLRLAFRGSKIVLRYLYKILLPLMGKGIVALLGATRKAFSYCIKLLQIIYCKIKRTKKIPEKHYANPAARFTKVKALLFYPYRILRRKLKVSSEIQGLNVALAAGKKERFSFRKIGKLALATAVVVLIVFGVTLVFSQKKNKDTTETQSVLSIIKEAQSKRQAALDAMIYQDENRAQDLLTEADQLVKKVLAAESRPENAEAQNLQTDIQNQFDKINHLTRLSDPLLIFDLKKYNPALNFASLVSLDPYLYTFSPDNNTILRIDPEQKEAVQVSPNFVNIGYLKKGIAIDAGKNILFVNNDNEFAIFDIAAFKIEKITAPSPFTPNEISDFAQYSNKIYTLNPNQNQIVKYSRTTSGLSKGAPWLSGGDVKDGISLAIDGNIYVLTSTGKILKFHSGEPKDFNLAAIKPSLASPSRIFTQTDYKNIYLLDPPTQRIIVIAKETGSMAAQFTSNQFSDLEEIWVTPDEKLIYVSTSQGIWRFENKIN